VNAAYHTHFEHAGDMFRKTWVDEMAASGDVVIPDPAGLA
jgi:hypothetical protein